MRKTSSVRCTLGAVATGSMLAVANADLSQAPPGNGPRGDAVSTENGAFGPETQIKGAMTAGIAFITEYSSLAYAGQALPTVMVVTEHDLQLRAHPPEILLQAEEDGGIKGRVSAFYDRKAKEIVLADVNSVNGPSMVHELVHYLQDINGKDEMFADHMVCLEAEAYDLQALWQTQENVDLGSRPDYGFLMTLQGVCNDADFSWVKSDDDGKR